MPELVSLHSSALIDFSGQPGSVSTRTRMAPSPLSRLQTLTVSPGATGSYRIGLRLNPDMPSAVSDWVTLRAGVAAQQVQDAFSAVLNPNNNDRDLPWTKNVAVAAFGNVYHVTFQGQWKDLLIRAGDIDTSSLSGGSVATAIRESGINYYGLGQLNIALGAGNDRFDVLEMSAVTSLDTGAGADQVVVASQANQAIAFSLAAGAGDDALTLDLSGENCIPGNGVTFDGGDGIDALTMLEGGRVDTLTYKPQCGDASSSSGDGEIDIDGRKIVFANLEPALTVASFAAANVIIDMSSARHSNSFMYATLENVGPNNDAISIVRFDNPSIKDLNFTNPTDLLQFIATPDNYDYLYLKALDTLDNTGAPLAAAVTVQMGRGNNTIALSAKTSIGTYTLQGQDGNDGLAGQNVPSVWNITGSNCGTIDDVTAVVFSGFEHLYGANQTDSFNFVGATAALSRHIVGNGSMDTLNYTDNGGGAVKVDLEKRAASSLMNEANEGFGSIENLAGSSSHEDTLVGWNAANTWTLNADGSGSVAKSGTTFTFSAVENLVGGTQTDTLTIDGSGTHVVPIDGMSLDGGAGDSDADQLRLVGGSAATLTYTPYSPIGANSLDFARLDVDGRKLNVRDLEAGVDTRSMPAATVIIDMSLATGEELTVRDAGDANQRVSIVDFANPLIPDLIFANPTTLLRIIGSPCADTIHLDALAALDYTGAPFAIPVTVDAGDGDDTVEVNAKTGNGTYTLDGQAGNDTILGPDLANTWNLTGIGSGNIGGPTVIAFTGFENLVGGTGCDTVTIDPAAISTGEITFDGHLGGGDVLALQGGPVTALTYTPYSPSGPIGPESGQLNIDGRKITFVGLEPELAITSTLAGTVVIDLSALIAGEEVTIRDVGDANDGLSIADFANPSIKDLVFANPTAQLQVIGSPYADTIHLNALDTLDHTGAPLAASVIVQAGSGNDTVELNAKTGSGSYALDGQSGDDTLIGPDLDNIWNITSIGDGTLGPAIIAFSSFENLVGGTGSDQVVMDPAAIPAGEIVFDWHLGGGDVLDLLGGPVTTLTYTPYSPTGPGGARSGQLDMDGTKITFVGLEPELAITSTWPANVILDLSALIAGEEVPLRDVGADEDRVSIVDFANPAIKDLAFATPTTLLRIIGSAFADTIHINALDTKDYTGAALAAAIAVEAGNGNDLVDVIAHTSSGTFTLDGQDGNDTLEGPDVDNAWNITGSGSGNIGGAAVIAFNGFATLQGGSAADTFNVTLPSIVTLKGGAGDDVFDIDAYVNGTILAEGGSDTLRGNRIDAVVLTGSVASGFAGAEPQVTGGFSDIDTVIGDGGTLTGQNATSTWDLDGTPTYTTSGNSLNFSGFDVLQGGTAADTFNVSAPSSFNLKGGDGDDVFDIDATSHGVDGQGGSDTLQGTQIDAVVLTSSDATGFDGTEPSIGLFYNLEQITGNGGKLTGPNGISTWGLDGTPIYTVSGRVLNFSGFATLQGGTAADTFSISAPSSFNLKGGAGANTLDYSSYGSGVIVDLDGGPASGVAGTIADIRNFTGSPLADTVYVDALPGGVTRTLSGGGGANVLYVDRKHQTATDNGSQITFGGGYGTISYSGFSSVILPPVVTGTTPSFASNGTLNAGRTRLDITFSEPVLGGGTAANYELQNLGPDSLLGTADDVVVPLSASYTGTTATLVFPALSANVYRLTVRAAITDVAGIALDGNDDGIAGGDDWLDFAVVTPSASSGFAAASTYATAATPQSIVAGDFNNDGISDLVTVHSSTNQVALWLADVSGGFRSDTWGTGGTPPQVGGRRRFQF